MGGQRKGLDMTLMGSFEPRWDGLPVLDCRWTRGKAKALLKVLALTDGRVLHREQVMDLLWPSLGPSAAANQLRKNLHCLRAELDRHGLSSPVTASHDLVLLAGDVQVDVDRMRGLADIAGSGDDPEAYERAAYLERRPAARGRLRGLDTGAARAAPAAADQFYDPVFRAPPTFAALKPDRGNVEAANCGSNREFSLSGLSRPVLSGTSSPCWSAA